MIRSTITIGLFLVAAAAPALAQQSRYEFPTHVRVIYEYQRVGGGDWTDYGVAVGLRAGRTTGELVALQARRFGLTDYQFGADLYTRTWSRAHVYTGVHVSPTPEVLPELDLRGELFQGFGDAWEGSAGARLLRYPQRDLEIFSTSLARYFPRWYARVHGSWIPDADGIGYGGLLRRYVGTAEGGRPASFVEVGAGGGDAVIELRSADSGNAPVDVRNHRFGRARVELYPAGRAGFAAGIAAYDYDGLETRWIYSAGIVYRP